MMKQLGSSLQHLISCLLVMQLCLVAALPTPPCPLSRSGAMCGCPTFILNKSESDSLYSSDQTSGVFSDAIDGEDSEYYYIDDMAFRKSRIASDYSKPLEQLNLNFWPGGIIFYVIDHSFTRDYRDKIIGAMTSIQAKVGSNHIEFRWGLMADGKPCRQNYLYIIRSNRLQCKSEVGMQSPYQTHVWLNERSCLPGTIQHEILHALGRYHEQCRSDRDQHLQILQSAMISTECANYFKVPNDTRDPTLKVPYDSFSIMHYGSCYFTCNGEYTMLTKAGSVITPNREELTALDVEKLHVMFPADAKINYTDKLCTTRPQIRKRTTRLVSSPIIIALTAVLAMALQASWSRIL